MNENNKITPLGITDFRNEKKPFGIKDNDRLQHIYMLGKTGVGKSTLLYNMAMSDIQRRNGLCFIDPHGDIAEKLMRSIPKEREEDVIYLNATDINPIAYNPLKAVHPDYHHLVASGIVSAFKKIWADSWGPRMEYILNFSLLTLLHYPDATLLDIQPLLTSKEFRHHVLHYVTNEHISNFWRVEFDAYSPTLRTEIISPILNKIGVFLTNLALKKIVGQRTNGFRMQNVLDTSKIFIVNLSKGQIGEQASAILGSMIITSIQLAAFYRAKKEEYKRVPFYLYVDEVHSFISLSFIDILAECRKYKLSLCIAHQYIEQLPEAIRAAIFGNVGTLIVFRIGAEDALFLEKEFEPEITVSDMIHLAKYSMYIKLCIDGTTSRPFSAKTIIIP